MYLRGTILQPWNWYSPRVDCEGKNLYQRLERDAGKIKKDRFTAVWLPPASACASYNDVGYGIRDWYDLDNTKYGNKHQFKKACTALNNLGIQIYHDQVFNHLVGGDPEKGIWCLHVKMDNKNEPLDSTKIWFQATIPTAFPWLELNWVHFDAYHPNQHDCWALSGKKFDREAKLDPLMGCDLDYDNIDLVKKLEEFGLWYKQEIPVDGYRFDAIKHIRPKGTLNFLHAMKCSAARNFFAIGEYLDTNLQDMHEYISSTYGQISLFDFPLQRKLVDASCRGNGFDMGSLFTGTLTNEQPVLSVPFVCSHDDMAPIDGNEKRGEYVGDWFVSQAYATILLRDVGYPMVGDVDMMRHGDMIRRYMAIRTDCTYGNRYDRFDHSNTVGWSFSGDFGFDNSMAVVITNGDYGKKWLPTCRPNTQYQDFTDALHHFIRTNADGWAEFECPSRNTSVWVESSKYNQLKSELYS
jgi:alpha-amylase